MILGSKHKSEDLIKAVATRMRNGSYKVSKETKKKQSESHKGINKGKTFEEMYGINAEEHKRKAVATRMRNGTYYRGEKHPSWKGGKNISDGYILVLSPTHPNADLHGYVREHRLIMEAHLGRTLLPTEVVHHINEDRKDNRIENLMLFSNNGKHRTFHNECSKVDGAVK